jgi:hypothetical protein
MLGLSKTELLKNVEVTTNVLENDKLQQHTTAAGASNPSARNDFNISVSNGDGKTALALYFGSMALALLLMSLLPRRKSAKNVQRRSKVTFKST